MKATHRIQSPKAPKKAVSVLEALEQRIAPAGVFKWTATGGGNWTNPANWTVVSGEAGAGFPNGVGDEAQFYNAITASSTITIPDNTEITLGKLRFDDNNSYTVSAIGSGHLVLDTVSGEAVIQSTNANGIATHFVNVPITLHDDTTFINVTSSPLVIQGTISDDQFYRNVTKNGTGVVTFSGSAANTYTGSTTVLDGSLRLAKTSGVNAVGTYGLQIGKTDGVGSPRLVLDANEQIPDSLGVVVYDNGEFDLTSASETTESVTVVNTGNVTATSGTLSVQRVYAGQFEDGAVGKIGGNLQFSAPAEVYVYSTAENAALEISAVIKGNSGFTLTGGGTLQLSTTLPQQYTGQTRVFAGTLELKSVTGDSGISNEIVIEQAGTLRVSSSFEIPDSATVTIHEGRLEVNSIEDFSHLVLDGGTVEIKSGTTFAIRAGGSVTVETSATAEASSIEGGGFFRLNDGNISFEIGQTAKGVDLKISAPMIGNTTAAALVKSGYGTLELAGEGTFQGGIFAQEGILLVSGNEASTVTVNGGTLQYGEYAQVKVAAITATSGRVVPALYGESGNLVLGGGATYAPSLDYFTRALTVTGAVVLGNPVLDFSLVTAPPSFFQNVIIDNDGVEPVVGTFAGLPEGATLKTPTGNFVISYVGGSGNDVTLTPVIAAPTILPGGKSATYTDSNGDRVTIRITKGTLTDANFRLLATGDGAELQELILEGATYEGTNLTVSAVPKNGLGDRHANVRHLNSNVDFGTISIAGDLGQFEIGSAGTPTPAFKSMTVDSIGLSAPIASQGSSNISKVAGAFGALKVKHDVIGANVQVTSGGGASGSVFIGGSLVPGLGNGVGFVSINGKLGSFTIAGDVVGGTGGGGLRLNGDVGKLTIGGSVLGGGNFQSGYVTVIGKAGSVSIGRDLVGGNGYDGGSLSISGDAGVVKIGGSVLGSSAALAGSINLGGDVKSLSIGGDLRGGEVATSGTISVTGTVAQLKVGGSVFGGASGTGIFAETFGAVKVARDIAGTTLGRATIAATGVADPTTAASAQAIASLTVGRNVLNADVLAGYDRSLLNPVEADVQIGKVAVKGDWTTSRLLAGVDSADGLYGNANDEVIAGGSSNIASRIASILIGGAVRGSVTPGDSYGFVAQEIGAVTVAGKKQALKTDTKDVIAFDVFGDTFAREL